GYVNAGGSQRQRNCCADTAAGAGNQSNLSWEGVHILAMRSELSYRHKCPGYRIQYNFRAAASVPVNLAAQGAMEKKKFLFDSLSGLIGDIAWQVSKEGHEVRYYIKDEKEADIADGFVAKSENTEKDADWADIIVFDDTLGQGEKAQALRAQGKRVVGGSAYSDRLEDDRSFGQEELKKAGVNIIPYREFDSFDEAME